MVIPGLVFLTFVLVPVIYTAYLSVFSWDGISPRRYVGLDNYERLVSDAAFRTALGNTGRWIVGSLVIGVVASFCLACFLRSKHVRFGGLVRALFFVPLTMNLVAVGVVFSYLLDQRNGIVTPVAEAIGLGRPDILGDPAVVTYALIAVFAWTYVGAALMLFDAGITQVPPELYEAADLEGASEVSKALHITLPMLRPVIFVVTLLAVVEAVFAFDVVRVMTDGGPGTASQTLGLYAYQTAFAQGQLGYGASVAFVMVAISLAAAVLYVTRLGSGIVKA